MVTAGRNINRSVRNTKKGQVLVTTTSHATKSDHASSEQLTEPSSKDNPTQIVIGVDIGDHATSQPSVAPVSASIDPARTLSRLRNTAIAHPQQQCTLTCYIPPSKIGAVIGRKGATIVQIQKEASGKSYGHSGPVRVSVVSQASTGVVSAAASADQVNNPGNGADVEPRTNPDEGVQPSVSDQEDSDLWTPVVIRGDPCGVFAAAKLLIPLVSSRNSSVINQGKLDAAEGGSQITSNEPRSRKSTLDYDPSDLDDVVLDVPILRSLHSAIIGKKGLTIATLSADHNVRIMVPRKAQEGSENSALNSSSSINIVQLEGELEDVERCLAEMLQIVTGNGGAYSSTEDAAILQPQAPVGSNLNTANMTDQAYRPSSESEGTKVVDESTAAKIPTGRNEKGYKTYNTTDKIMAKTQSVTDVKRITRLVESHVSASSEHSGSVKTQEKLRKHGISTKTAIGSYKAESSQSQNDELPTMGASSSGVINGMLSDGDSASKQVLSKEYDVASNGGANNPVESNVSKISQKVMSQDHEGTTEQVENDAEKQNESDSSDTNQRVRNEKKGTQTSFKRRNFPGRGGRGRGRGRIAASASSSGK